MLNVSNEDLHTIKSIISFVKISLCNYSGEGCFQVDVPFIIQPYRCMSEFC